MTTICYTFFVVKTVFYSKIEIKEIKMKKYMIFLCCFLIFMLPLVANTKIEAASNYSGVWSSYSDIGDYGIDEMNVVLKDNGKNVSVEVSNDTFQPLYDSRESYVNGIGKMRSYGVFGTVKFNSKGQASFNFKDDYNNGKLDIQLQKDYMQITWKGKTISEYAFPNGTFKLFKKITVGQTELKKMGTFLSNFTELQLNKFDMKHIDNSDLIRFGIWHNYLNNYNSRISSTKDSMLYISKANVDESITKYFGIKFKNHKTVDGFKFNKQGYIFDGADGEPAQYVKVTKVYDLGNNKLRLSGQVYNPDDSNLELKGLVEAVVKVQKEKSVSRYVLEKLSVKY